jgi:hypothetical protein
MNRKKIQKLEKSEFLFTSRLGVNTIAAMRAGDWHL